MRERGLAEGLAVASLDSTIINLHPNGAGGKGPSDRSLARDLDDEAARSGTAARAWLDTQRDGRSRTAARAGSVGGRLALLMNRVYEDEQTRGLVVPLGWDPVIPPKRNQLFSRQSGMQ